MSCVILLLMRDMMCAKIGGNIMDQLSYGSDLGKDVRIQYIDALRRGKDSTE